MPGILNPFIGVTPAGGGPVSEPWGEVTRSSTVSGGKITISGLDLSGVIIVKLFVYAVVITTDDSDVMLRFVIGGSEISTGYRWALGVARVSTDHDSSSDADTSIHLTSGTSTQKVGNAATEAFSAVITVPNPSSTALYKKAYFQCSYSNPAGEGVGIFTAGGQLDNAGAIEGFVLMGSSNIISGGIIVLGVS